MEKKYLFPIVFIILISVHSVLWATVLLLKEPDVTKQNNIVTKIKNENEYYIGELILKDGSDYIYFSGFIDDTIVLSKIAEHNRDSSYIIPIYVKYINEYTPIEIGNYLLSITKIDDYRISVIESDK